MGKTPAKTTKGNAVAEYGEDVLQDMMENAGHGNEFGKDDLAIPFLRIVQAQSPERKKSDSKHIAGIDEGDIFNTVTRDNLGTEIRVIPVKYEKVYNEWIPNQGGFVASYHDREEAYEEAGAGNEITDTANHYCLVEDPETGEWGEAVISLTSTGLKISRKWNSLATMRKVAKPDGGTFTPPLYAQVFTLSTTEESNDKGTWFNWRVEAGPLVPEIDPALYARAKAFRSMIDEGEARASFEEVDDETGVILDEDEPDF